MKVPLIVTTFLVLAGISASGGEHLRIAVSPARSMAPSNLNIRARMIPHAENRALEIVAESDEFYRSSQVSLEGDRAPATIMFEFRGVPGGQYSVYGILTDGGGRRRAVAQQQVMVIGSGSGQ